MVNRINNQRVSKEVRGREEKEVGEGQKHLFGKHSFDVSTRETSLFLEN